MTKSLRAVYENGVFRPLEPISLEEHLEVTVTISDRCETAFLSEVSCYELAKQAGIIGAGDNLPSDLSTHRAYFEGFGRE